MKKKYATEGLHWYRDNGEPCHTVPNKSKGGERPTNLRDARSLGLVPSVTSILQIINKPGLNVWKENNILLSALTLPKIDGESLDEYAKRIREDANVQAQIAREDGNRIHGILEKYYATGDMDFANVDLISAVDTALVNHFGEQNWLAEKSFCEGRYGGKVDLHSKEVVIDFKTTTFTENSKPRGYEGQDQQLAAYAVGLKLMKFKLGAGEDKNGECKVFAKESFFPRCANVYISTSVPNLVHIKEWTQEELARAYRMFEHALGYWCESKNYFPGE